MTQPRDIFISYVHDDEGIALQLARALEDAGYTTWHYTRDCVPGATYLRQTRRAIVNAQVFIVLLSRRSLRSRQVGVELIRAHESGKPMIPVLLDLTWPRFQEERDDWAQAVGDAVGVEMAPGGVPSLLPRLFAGLKELYIEPREVLPQTPATAPDTTPLKVVQIPCLSETPALLVDRESALHTLRDAWRRVQTGTTQAVLISGDMGVGKTRVVHQFVCELVGSDAYVLVSHAYRGQPGPYEGVQRLLQPVCEQGTIPDIPASHLASVATLLPEITRWQPALPQLPKLSLMEDRARRRWAIGMFVSGLARRAPVVLVLDDLQWTDAASVEFIQHLLTQRARDRFLIVGVLRLGEAMDIHALRRDLRQTGALDEAALGPLTKEQAATLLHTSLCLAVPPRLVERLYEQTEGNAFFLVQTAKMLEEQQIVKRVSAQEAESARDDPARDYALIPIPKAVEDILRPELDLLGDEERALLNAAAVLGYEFDIDMVRALGGLRSSEFSSAVRSLLKQKLMREDDDGCHFAPGLLRDIVYAAMPGSERRDLHRRAALLKALSLKSQAPIEIRQLAHHYDRAGDWKPALEYHLRAGQEALRLCQMASAGAHFTRAKTIAETKIKSVPAAAKLAYLDGLGDVLVNAGEFEAALESYRQALAGVPDGSRQSAILCWKISIVYERQSDYARAIEWVDRGLAMLPADDRSEEYCLLCRERGMVLFRKGEPDQALTWASRSLAQETSLAHILMAIVLRGSGRFESAYEHCQSAIQIAEQAKDVINLAKGYSNLAVVCFEMDRWLEAVKANEQALAMQAEAGDAYMHAMTLCNLSDVHRNLGDLNAALAYAREGLGEYQKLDTSAFGQALGHLNLGWALLDMGQAREARTEHLQVAHDLMVKSDISDLRSDVERGMAECLLAEGDLAEAEAMAATAGATAATYDSPVEVAKTKRTLARTYRAEGRPAEASQVLTGALEQLPEKSALVERGRLLLELAGLYVEDKSQQENAKRMLGDARSILQTVGARPDLERIGALEKKLAA